MQKLRKHAQKLDKEYIKRKTELTKKTEGKRKVRRYSALHSSRQHTVPKTASRETFAVTYRTLPRSIFGWYIKRAFVALLPFSSDDQSPRRDVRVVVNDGGKPTLSLMFSYSSLYFTQWLSTCSTLSRM